MVEQLLYSQSLEWHNTNSSISGKTGNGKQHMLISWMDPGCTVVIHKVCSNLQSPVYHSHAVISGSRAGYFFPLSFCVAAAAAFLAWTISTNSCNDEQDLTMLQLSVQNLAPKYDQTLSPMLYDWAAYCQLPHDPHLVSLHAVSLAPGGQNLCNLVPALGCASWVGLQCLLQALLFIRGPRRRVAARLTNLLCGYAWQMPENRIPGEVSLFAISVEMSALSMGHTREES